MSNSQRRRKRPTSTEAEQVQPYAWEQAGLKYASLPPLPDNFHHAIIIKVSHGPRREVTLTLKPLVWIGQQGQYGSEVDVRLGGIVNGQEVEAAFSQSNVRQSELAHLRYWDGCSSKIGDLYVEAVFERISVRVVVHCSTLVVSDAKPRCTENTA